LFAASGKYGGYATTFVGTEYTTASSSHRETDSRFVFQTEADNAQTLSGKKNCIQLCVERLQEKEPS